MAITKLVADSITSGAIASTPAFEVYDANSQTMSDATWTKLQFDTETFDTDNAFDSTTNYRFTPQTAGKYFLYSKSRLDPTGFEDLRDCGLKFYKNGSEVAHTFSRFIQGGNTVDAGTMATPFIAAIIDLNGSTDYVEVFANANSLDNSNVVTENSIFGGYKIIE